MGRDAASADAASKDPETAMTGCGPKGSDSKPEGDPVEPEPVADDHLGGLSQIERLAQRQPPQISEHAWCQLVTAYLIEHVGFRGKLPRTSMKSSVIPTTSPAPLSSN